MDAKLKDVPVVSIKLPKPKFIVNEKGKKISVVLDIKTYNQLIEELEDIIDNRLMDEVENEPTVPWEEVKESLRKEGKL